MDVLPVWFSYFPNISIRTLASLNKYFGDTTTINIINKCSKNHFIFTSIDKIECKRFTTLEIALYEYKGNELLIYCDNIGIYLIITKDNLIKMLEWLIMNIVTFARVELNEKMDDDDENDPINITRWIDILNQRINISQIIPPDREQPFMFHCNLNSKQQILEHIIIFKHELTYREIILPDDMVLIITSYNVINITEWKKTMDELIIFLGNELSNNIIQSYSSIDNRDIIIAPIKNIQNEIFTVQLGEYQNINYDIPDKVVIPPYNINTEIEKWCKENHPYNRETCRNYYNRVTQAIPNARNIRSNELSKLIKNNIPYSSNKRGNVRGWEFDPTKNI